MRRKPLNSSLKPIRTNTQRRPFLYRKIVKSYWPFMISLQNTGRVSGPGSPLSLQEARELVERYVQHYNEKRLHSAIGYVTPMVKLEGSENKIFLQRDKKLEEARKKRIGKNKSKIAA
jgi:transposase InsO family protein